VVSQFCWCICRDILGWDFVPSHSDDLTILCRELSLKQTQKLMFLFGCVLWSIWLTRNDYVFRDIVICSPNSRICRAISLMQRWKILHKEKGQRWIDAVTLKLQARLSSLRLERWLKSQEWSWGREVAICLVLRGLFSLALQSFLCSCFVKPCWIVYPFFSVVRGVCRVCRLEP
jgi:hypothetical protein